MSGPLSEDQLGVIRRANAETFLKGRQDARRIAGLELGSWYAAVAHRDEYPANIYFVGDSWTEGYGASDDYRRWTYYLRDALQRKFRQGGIGFIPTKHAQGITWLYATNPDGKNTWSLSGTEVDNVDYGYGFGRRASWLNTTASRTITVDCDRFWIAYSQVSGFGTLTVDVDAGTPFAQTGSVSTSVNPALSGRIWDSSSLAVPLTLGSHTVKVTATSAAIIVDGIMVFYTDATAGVHVWEGGHSSYPATAYDGKDSAGTDGFWADVAAQPANATAFSDFVGNGTTTVTSATATFTDNDIGEYIIFEQAATTRPANGVARIIARASASSITVDRVVGSATHKVLLNRSQVTNAAITSGSGTMTSASNPWNPWDVGLYVQGASGIPAGTFIRRYVSAGNVELSKPATATQSSQTVRTIGKQARWCAPDLLCIQFGANDAAAANAGAASSAVGVTTESFKQSIRDIVTLASERAGIGYPTGYLPPVNPSVVLVGAWSPYFNGLHMSTAELKTTSGSTTIFSDQFDFDPLDVGKGITSPSNTPIAAGTTIASVQSYRQATLSQNAAATTTTGSATITSRVFQDKHWQRMRMALHDLAVEKNWRLFDLYSVAGYIGPDDPLRLTYDGAHANNHGAKLVADELSTVLVGQPYFANIPQGIFDAKGDLPVGAAADVAGKLPAGTDGQHPTFRAGSTLGVIQENPNSSSAYGQVVPVIGGTTYVTTGILPAPTSTATTFTNADDNEASWVQHATSTTQFNACGIVSAAFTVTRSGRLPEFAAYIKTDTTTIASIAYAIGLASASLDVASAIAPAASVVGAYFLYNTTVHGTAFWRTVTSDGTTRNTQTTTAAIAVNTTYRLRIVCKGVRGSSIASVDFYVNDVLVATHITNLPTFSTALGYGVRVEALAGSAARNIRIARVSLSGP